jgi:putative OmpL-like beta-barrel porin-2
MMTIAFAGVSGPTFRGALATVGCSLLLAGSAAAQSPAASLQQAIQAAAVAEPQAPAPPAAPAENPVLTFFKNTELSGFVDTYYTYNFNKPAKACATVGGVGIFNCLHNFDVAHNAFSLNLAEVALEKKPTTDSRGGFRVDLDYGSAAAIVAGADPSPTSINQNIQQAYVSYLAPAGKGTVQLDFGKFVTQHGAEVIETKDNWNYSRSLLFALAIPYYHEGVRVAYSPNAKATLGASISNGWNNVVENNTGKTAGFMAILKPTAAVSWTLNYMVGPEQAADNSDLRHLFDTTIAYTASPKVSLMANYDYGKDTISGAGVKWQGVAGYLRYTPNAWFALVPRYEFIKDDDGFMTGTSQNVKELTLTAEFKHKDGVLMRVEYRGDMADKAYFLKKTSSTAKNQNVFTIGWVYAFSSKTP